MDIHEKVKDLLISSFLGEENRSELAYDTPLISSGIMDSITTLKVISDIERAFNIHFAPSEVDRENLDSIDRIAKFINEKLKSTGG
ncbi:MAG: acyl carrier protein [Flavobacteriales bacterium]